MDELEKIEIKKLVPVVAKINAGKSNLLNILYNMNFLECGDSITTKFINIIRYNPNIEKPCLYHLNIKKEGENYCFYKDSKEVYEGEKNITEANKNINSKLLNMENIKFEEIFYMTEINGEPFIKDKDYLLENNLCDIPGLSEYVKRLPNIKINEKNKIEENKDKKNIKEEQKDCKDKIEEKLIKIGEEYSFILNKKKTNVEEVNKIFNEIRNEKRKDINNEDNEEDDIFYKNKDDGNYTYLTEIFKIMKNYIDEAIIIVSIENYYYEENFILITKLHQVLEKELSNCLLILNKVDLSTDLNRDIKKFKGEIFKHFPKCQTFNLNLNNFIPLSVKQVENELLMKKSFKNLIYYHFYNYIFKNMNQNNNDNHSFIEHLKFVIKIEEIDMENIASKIEELNNSEINNEIFGIVKELINEFQGRNLRIGFSEEDFKNSDNIDIKKKKNFLKIPQIFSNYYIYII